MPKQQCQVGNTSQQEDLEGIARDVLRKRGVLYNKYDISLLKRISMPTAHYKRVKSPKVRLLSSNATHCVLRCHVASSMELRAELTSPGKCRYSG